MGGEVADIGNSSSATQTHKIQWPHIFSEDLVQKFVSTSLDRVRFDPSVRIRTLVKFHGFEDVEYNMDGQNLLLWFHVDF